MSPAERKQDKSCPYSLFLFLSSPLHKGIWVLWKVAQANESSCMSETHQISLLLTPSPCDDLGGFEAVIVALEAIVARKILISL
eukprot:1159219-Pelagomonas_calceolata.AAC.1